MKPIVTKAQIRAELDAQIQDFLHEGGTVKPIPKGESGHLGNHSLFANQGGAAPPQPRTPVDEELKALEERKHPQPGSTQASKGKNRSRKKQLITDDFGEPLRWVWVED